MSASNSPLFIGFYKYFFKYEKGSLDELLSRYSKDIGSDFFVVQIGANDGISHDPIHKFVKRDNWSGVLLEPQRYVYETFLSGIYKKNKGVHCVNAAMGYEDGATSIFKIGFSNSRWATGLASFDRDVLQKAFDSGHVAKKCLKEGINIPTEESERIIEEQVEIVSTAGLIEKYNIKKIDLLMIDTEGFDYEIVKMFDVPKSAPGMIAFEDGHLGAEDYAECRSMLSQNGYDVMELEANTIALKKELNKYSNFF